jgi:hypothetical protein
MLLLNSNQNPMNHPTKNSIMPRDQFFATPTVDCPKPPKLQLMKTYHQFIPSKTSTNNVDGGQDKLDGLSY